MPRRTIFWTITVVAVLAAAWQAWDLRWSCDDAYISFRYAQHFAEGHGLVFNLDPAEAPVEGYTNFSWTMWLAVGWWLGCVDEHLETWSIVSGVLCHAATVWLLAALAWRATGGRAFVPIAACGYAAIHHAASLAPAGLETALFVLLGTVLLRSTMSLRCARDARLAGFVAVLTAMTRPDGALFVAAAGAFVLFDAWRRRAPALAIAYAAPLLLVFAPYLLWRHAYYGYWVPNTFYAKAGGDPYPGQGFVYVWEFAKCYHALALPLLALLWFGTRRGDVLAPIDAWLGRRPWLAIGSFMIPYTAFVVWVGGDFMFGRFLLPVLPALLLSLDIAFARWRRPVIEIVCAVVLVAGLLLRSEPPWLGDYTLPVSDNRRFSMQEIAGIPGIPATEAFRRAGNSLRTLFDGLPVRIAIGGGQANLAFRSRAPVAIECAAGLTDAYIAHLPLAQRGKPGHERDHTKYPGYLERRGVHFMFEGSFDKHIENGQWVDDAPWRQLLFPSDVGPVPARLVVWDRELMRELRRRAPNMAATDLEQHLDAYIAELPSKPKEQVRADYAKFRAAWFDHTDDPQREAAFERFLQGG